MTPTNEERVIWALNRGKSRLPLVAHVRRTRGLSAHEALAVVRGWEDSGALSAWSASPTREEIDITGGGHSDT